MNFDSIRDYAWDMVHQIARYHKVNAHLKREDKKWYFIVEMPRGQHVSAGSSIKKAVKDFVCEENYYDINIKDAKEMGSWQKLYDMMSDLAQLFSFDLGRIDCDSAYALAKSMRTLELIQ